MPKEEMFPTLDPHDWNGGVWPPQALRKRWQELYLSILAGSAAVAPAEYEATNPDQLHTKLSMHAITITARAGHIADWALRVEIERGAR